MSATNYPGIDYSLGKANCNFATGIHYGVISQHSISPDCFNDIEPVYGDATCPVCGGEVKDSSEIDTGEKDYYCSDCKGSFWSEQCFPDEPIGLTYDKHGYCIRDCLNSDLFILESPYYTHAQFCSPCVPGAGNLDHYCSDGPKTYCLGHDWFESNKAPYPVYSVETGEEILPES